MQDLSQKRTAVDFFAIAEAAGIPVEHCPLPACGSLSLQMGDRCYIGLDNSTPLTSAQQQARIGHELGHCLYGGFYTRSTPFDMSERHEVRADRWYILQAIPRHELFELLRTGRDVWEIAELLNTTEDYIRQAYYFYKENPVI